MNRSCSVRSVFPIARIHWQGSSARAVVWSACFLSTFSFLLVLLVLPGAPNEAGLAQTKTSNKPSAALAQQPDAVKPKKETKRGVADASRSATNTIATQPPSQPPPLTFTINNETPYQGELVIFTPARQTHYGFEFTLEDGDIKTTKPGEPDLRYRFKNSDWHTVTARALVPGAVFQIEPIKINVKKTPLTVCGDSANSSRISNLHFFVGQEISLATHDLNDPAVTYRFVFDEADAGASTRAALPNSIRGGDGEPVKAATFIYPSPDRSKKVHAELVWTDQERQEQRVARSDPKVLRIDPLPQDSVDLKLTPEKPAVNQEITLTASLNLSLPQPICPFKEDSLQYRFEFDDGTPVRDWSPDSTAKHAYNKEGTHRAIVGIRVAGGMAIEKQFEIPVVLGQISEDGPRNPPPTICVPCLIIGCVIVVVCGTLLTYFVYRLIRKPPSAVPPKPSPGFSQPAPTPNQAVSPQVTYLFDSGERTAADKSPQLLVSIQVRLNAQTNRSETQLILNEGQLIKSVRRHNV